MGNHLLRHGCLFVFCLGRSHLLPPHLWMLAGISGGRFQGDIHQVRPRHRAPCFIQFSQDGCALGCTSIIPSL